MRDSLKTLFVSKLSLFIMLGLIAGAAWASNQTPIKSDQVQLDAGCCVTGNCCCPGQGACCDVTKRRSQFSATAAAGSSCCQTGNCCCPGAGACCATQSHACCKDVQK